MNTELEKILSTIDNQIVTDLDIKSDLGVISGSAGLALFQFYYSKLNNREYNYDIGTQILINSISKINEGYAHDTFCNGLAGFGWVLDHLEQENFIEIDNDEISVKFDDYLYEKFKHCITQENFDFLQGAIGHSHYFLKRYKNTKSLIQKQKYKRYLSELITFFDSFSNNKSSEINIGLAHGLASIINFSARLCYFEEFKDRIIPSLQINIQFLLKLKTNQKAPFFPDLVSTDTQTHNNRLAWCYGDLGIAITLWQASKSLKDKELSKIALNILHDCSKRKNKEVLLKADIGFCHGSFGIAHLFYYMYKETKDESFFTTSSYWISNGITKLNKTQIDDQSLLEGLAGIGLTIIDFLSPTYNNWDECLLIS